MARYEHTIHINAAPDVVWNALVDVANWPSWTPTTLEADPHDDSPFTVGKQARLRLKGGGTGVWTVTKVEPGRYFAWESDFRGVHTVAGHRVELDSAGSKVTLVLEPTGLMAALLSLYIARIARENLQLEAEGLKRHCEAKSATQYAI